MADYVTAPIPVEPEDFQAQVEAAMQAAIPGWRAGQGNLDDWLILAFCQIAAQLGESVTETLASIFRWFGANLVGIAPLEAASATGAVTVTVVDANGHLLPADTLIAYDSEDGSTVYFQLAEDAIVLAGSTSIAGVPIIATDPGAVGNLITGGLRLVEPFDFVQTVVLQAPTNGGSDAEDDDVYLNRLRDELRLLSPRPILPDDFAVLAKRRIAGIARATAVSGLNPNTGTTSNERTVCVFAIDDQGAAPSDASLRAARDMLEAMRETGFVVYVVAPSYTRVDVTFAAKAWPGWDPAVVKAQAEDAVRAYLSPATWGQPSLGETVEWVNDPVVRMGELYAVLNAVEGLHYVTALAINGVGQDFALDGIVALPKVGAVTGAVVA